MIRRRTSTSDWWSPLLAGAAPGGLIGWLVLRRGDDQGRRWHRMTRVLDGAGRKTAEPDVEAMTTRLRERAGAGGLRVRSLGQGILELVGTAHEEADVHSLLDFLAAEPGVSVVVNRVWTAGAGSGLPQLGATPMSRASGTPDDPAAPAP